MARVTRATSVLFIIAAVLLVMLTAATRLAAPWRMGVINDEMLHLQSWRNQYRTDDIYPLFLEKLEASNRLDEIRFEQVRRLYHSSPLVQRALLVLVDGHPPAFPILAEIVEAVTHSSLIAFRFLAVIPSLLAVLLMYLLGRELLDRTLGLWLAGLLAIGHLSQMYAGLGRPYALAQCALILAICVFAAGLRGRHASPWRLWLACLVAQATNWLIWPILGPLVLIELIRRWRGGAGVMRLVAQTWWYALLSVLLLLYMFVQMLNPTLSNLAGPRSLLAIWIHFSLASPFAAIDGLLGLSLLTVLSPAGLMLLLSMLGGLACVLADARFVSAERGDGLAHPSVRVALVLVLLCALATPIVLASGTRIAMTWVVGPMIMAGIGLRWLLRNRSVSHAAIIVLLLAFGTIRFAWPEDPYARAFWSETNYDQVALLIQRELEPGDVWCAYPRYRGDCLYRYADLPEPVQPIDEQQFRDFLTTLPRRGHSVIIFTRKNVLEEHRILRSARLRWDSFHNYVVVKVPPAYARY